MVSTFILAFSDPALGGGIQGRIQALDPKAIIVQDIHPESFIVRTKLNVLHLGLLPGVSHVYELDDKGQTVDTFGELNRLQRLKGAARKANCRLEEDQIAKQIDRELSKLRRDGKLGVVELDDSLNTELEK